MPKVNATTKWTVLPVNTKIQSPQRGSVNATTKWLVHHLRKGAATGQDGAQSQLDKLSKGSTVSSSTVSDTECGNLLGTNTEVMTFTNVDNRLEKGTSSESSSFQFYCQVKPEASEVDCRARCTSEPPSSRHRSSSGQVSGGSEGHREFSENEIATDDSKLNSDEGSNIAMKEKVPVQHWDHYVKDLSKSIKKTKPYPSASLTYQESPQRWDGSRKTNSADVVAVLLKEKSFGFGERVFTWEGSRSILDEAKDLSREHDGRKHWLQKYEEDLDRGKTKKVKKKCINDSFDNSHNVFQSFQNLKKMEKQKVPGHHLLRTRQSIQ